MTKTIGYIVVAKNYGEPLELVNENKDYAPGILLRAAVTLFSTRTAAQAAIDRTVKWAAQYSPNNWANPNNFQIYRVINKV